MAGRTRPVAVLAVVVSAVALVGALLGTAGAAVAPQAAGAGGPAVAQQETPTTAAPDAPATDSTTTSTDPERRITQDTPALGGVIAVWLLGIVGVAAILGAGWWRTREP